MVAPGFHVSEQLGAWQIAGDSRSGTVRFRLYFPAGADPQIRSIQVAGDFQRALGQASWDFAAGPALAEEAARPEGTFWSVTLGAALDAGYYQYKYLVTFEDGTTRKVSDPFA